MEPEVTPLSGGGSTELTPRQLPLGSTLSAWRGSGSIYWRASDPPEIRYTRWNMDVINEFGSHGYFVTSGMNQVQVLVGVSWRTRL